MRIDADYLIVGSGLAGLFFALKASERGSVILFTKEEPHESNTSYAQGGIASVMDEADSCASHVRDTLASGDGLCDLQVVETIVEDGPDAVRELIDLGVRFTRRASGGLSLGREGGHSASRVVHADDMTGRELVRTLLKACQERNRVWVYPHHLAVDLIVDAEGGCGGAWVLDKANGQLLEARAPVNLLATGGCGQIYLHTTNPGGATGDGVAMAYRAGARVGNLEFVQFHPTMLYHPGGESFLISEAVRGYGGVLVDSRGERFVEAYHPMGSLATRDVVARAIVDELRKSGAPCVYLDVTDKDGEATQRRFPNIYRHCLEIGVDMTREPIPVVPAAHYMCGGVLSDLRGRTDVKGLYASGEVAMTGFHGANRLASNSLLEAAVLARRALEDVDGGVVEEGTIWPIWDKEKGEGRPVEEQLERQRERLRRCMWENVGIVRSDDRLEAAAGELIDLAAGIKEQYRLRALDPGLIELRNMVTVAELVTRSAQMRLESRGGHFNRDHPERDDADWQRATLLPDRDLRGDRKAAQR